MMKSQGVMNVKGDSSESYLVVYVFMIERYFALRQFVRYRLYMVARTLQAVL